MSRTFAVALLATLLPSLAFAAPSATPARKKLLVMPSKGEQGLSTGAVALLDEILMSEVSKDPRYDVVGVSEVAKLMQVEVMKQQAGCDQDSCMAELGGALGAEYMVTSTLGRLGESFIVTVKMFHVPTARVQRWTETVPAKEDALADAVRRCVHGVLPDGNKHKWSYVALGAGGAAAIAGGAFGMVAWSAVKSRNQELGDATAYNADDSRARGMQTGANVAFSLAATAVVTGAVLWFVEGRQ